MRQTIVISLALTCALALTACQKSADGLSGATVDLPAEYFIMLPLNGHRRLFAEFAPDAAAPAESSSLAVPSRLTARMKRSATSSCASTDVKSSRPPAGSRTQSSNVV